MRKLLSVLFLVICLAFVPQAHAQTNFTVGVSGADAFDNLSAGVTAGIDPTFLKRVQVSLYDIYSPYEVKVGLGQGHANIASAGLIGWVRPTFGFEGKIEDTGYSVTQVSKTAFDVLGGFVKKTYLFGVPTRIGAGGVFEINNGIVNGVETNHMEGAYIRLDGRMYCSSTACLRIIEQFEAGHVLTQGNPLCDGTIGNGSQVGFSPCPRKGAFGGGVSLSLVLDLHRHQSDPYALY